MRVCKVSLIMATIVYSPNRAVSSSSNPQYGSYGSINKLHRTEHHHMSSQSSRNSERLTSVAPPPLSIYQVKEHRNYMTMSSVHSRNYNYQRNKSAVEMLAESKPYYVKSENVLDRHQQLSSRGGGSVNGGGSGSLSCE